MNDSPPGLLSRRAFQIDGGKWVLHEEWDISVPGCPMIKMPWGSQPPGNLFVRKVEMTDEEHRAYQQQTRDNDVG